jgi:hypothetical protein
MGLYFTVPLCLAALIWLFLFLRGSGDKVAPVDTRANYVFGVPLIFLSIFGIWALVFPNHVINHEVLLHPLSPFFPLAFGLIISRLPKWARKPSLAALVVVLMVAQLGAVLALRYSHQDGYPVDYPLSRAMESATDYREHIITHVTLAPRYYQFYCDRDMLMGVGTIPEFLKAASTGRYTTFVALDLDTFLKYEPGIQKDPDALLARGHLAVGPELLSYLRAHYPCVRASYFLKFDLTKSNGPDLSAGPDAGR